MIRTKLSHPLARLPRRNHPTDAGLDIYAVECATLRPGVHAVLSTGVHVEIPVGFAGLIWPRSGLATRHGVDILAGVADAPYRGEIRVSLINHGHEDVEVKPGDRIAQMLIQPVMGWECQQVDELSDTPRGEQGFGSSGR